MAKIKLNNPFFRVLSSFFGIIRDCSPALLFAILHVCLHWAIIKSSYLENVIVEDFAIYYLVNTSGNIQKNKTNAKDGSDWYFYSDKNGVAKLYTSDKKVGKTNITIKDFATITTESDKKDK